MIHHHFKLYERQRLVKLIKQGYSQRKIAELLGFSQAAISKEIRRNSNYKKEYIVNTAQDKAQERRRRASSHPRKQNPEIIKYIKEKLEFLVSRANIRAHEI